MRIIAIWSAIISSIWRRSPPAPCCLQTLMKPRRWRRTTARPSRRRKPGLLLPAPPVAVPAPNACQALVPLPRPGCASARQHVKEQIITLFQGLRTAKLVAVAAAEPAAASEQARASITHEVRIGMKPQLDLLDTEREAIAAAARSVEANAARVTIACRLAAALGGED